VTKVQAMQSETIWLLDAGKMAAELQLASNLETFWQLGAVHEGAFPVVDCSSMLAGQIIQFGVVQHAVS